jgi:hypothetical protein
MHSQSRVVTDYVDEWMGLPAYYHVRVLDFQTSS